MLNEESQNTIHKFNYQNGLLASQYRLHLSQTLNSPPMYSSSNHILTHLLKGHAGCVNTLNWSADGQLLLSGSDDQSLIVHKYTPGIPNSFKLLHKLPTAHSNNIFDAKFNPLRPNQIVSVAFDGRVCVLEDWQNRLSPMENLRTLVASQTDSAKKLEFLDANNILVGCEDGNVIQFDLREEKPVKKVKINLKEQQISIHSISKCPSAPHLFAVAGTDPFIRLFDLRSSLEKTAYTWTPPLKVGKKMNFCTGIRFSRFGYSLAANYIKDGPYLIDPIYQTEKSAPFLQEQDVIKTAGLTRELHKWRQTKHSYSLGHFAAAEKHLRELILQHKNLPNDENWREVMAHEVFNRVLCLGQLPTGIPGSETIREDLLMVFAVVVEHWPARYLLVMYMFSLGLIEHGGMLCDLFLKVNPYVNNEWTRKLEHIRSIAAVCELDPAQIPHLIPKDFKKACAEMPFTDMSTLEATKRIISGSSNVHGYLQHYPGIIHERTIKGISFVGDSDQFLGVGSDGGYAFLFDTSSKDLILPVWAAKNDNTIVNVVEGHPFLPCLAVSGIDHTVKIWQPRPLFPFEPEAETPKDYSPVPQSEIPDLMRNLPNLQGGIHILESEFDPFSVDPNALVIYLNSLV